MVLECNRQPGNREERRSASGSDGRRRSVQPQNMSRRGKLAETEDDGPTPSKLPHPNEPPLDFTSPQSLFESFIAPMTSEEFFTYYWEKKPLLIQRSDPAIQSYYQSLFPMTDLKLASGKGIYYGRDVNMCKCKNGKKVLLPRRGKANYLEILKDFRTSRATIQFHQPQRFNDKLWQIMEKLECFFGALVGCNVYITPTRSQGLPPHHDDVEVFILQVEGQKRWRLYEPLVQLAREYDVSPADKVTTPTHDILLKEGDLLYFPRGTIHEAETPANSPHSTHVTISTYQNNSWVDYLQDVMPALLRDAAKESVDLRKGIPRQQLLCLDPSRAGVTLSALLSDIGKRIEGKCQLRSCEMLRDFMGSRLPPYLDVDSSDQEKSDAPPNLNSTISLQYKDYAAVTTDLAPEAPEPSEELMIYVFHALKNKRKTHMVSDNEESPPVSGLRFPLSYMDALKALWCEKPVRVKDLPLLNDRDKENLAISLWSEGLLETVPAEA
ncbi:ribosomal oxygenase 2 isoform X2 [Phyllobates terribilis]|uniref:ribosomal oxygenase 2 isoform X2 n=1 Tax=Phyllobates terribilis TaxID=111132 RepID=UPI003CCAA1C3